MLEMEPGLAGCKANAFVLDPFISLFLNKYIRHVSSFTNRMSSNAASLGLSNAPLQMLSRRLMKNAPFDTILFLYMLNMHNLFQNILNSGFGKDVYNLERIQTMVHNVINITEYSQCQ